MLVRPNISSGTFFTLGYFGLSLIKIDSIKHLAGTCEFALTQLRRLECASAVGRLLCLSTAEAV